MAESDGCNATVAGGRRAANGEGYLPPPGWRPVNDPLGTGGDWLPLSRAESRVWSLVLASRGIPYRQRKVGGGRLLLVPESLFIEARRQLELYRLENRDWPPPLPESRPLPENQLATLAVFGLLCAFSFLIELPAARDWLPRVNWQIAGSARAGLILDGQWWRTATALTLHTGGLHLAGNVVFGILTVGWLARELGSGPAWLLVLLAGMGGNWLNALLQAPAHDAVGASTAVFAAVGLIAGLNLVRYRRPLWRRWALPLAAALGLLAMLGAGDGRTDLGAHLFGLLTGLVFGVVAAWGHERHGRPGPWLNRLLALAAAGIMALAWWLAIRS
ncbi:membrane associated rhomboid family serine protease [Geothermobacter ehrlichii]|uniref:Membrane associated rhomboid family serine protease n=1 Tax=Geothermobacter ehrlichii TaxID=213224 RepID=A0A5D3WKW0_9BACT|nr:rhomboid family intramembrane serine protease [Geothermobacter ehrlichii]TYO99290.1 membrane associated rhomboid family serine protease [Geothermobacter ehrlichii]